MAIQIQIRRDTAANWTSANPTLAQGEIGLETDTIKMKFGDGSTAWGSLAYFTGTAVLALNDITDVDLTGSPAPINGDVLKYDGSDWVHAADAHSSELNELTDVNTSTPTDRFVLVADGVDFESRYLVKLDISDADWISDIVSESIGDLSDVDLTGSPALATDDVLIFDGANWVHVPKTTVGVLDHVNLLSIGSNSHAAIDIAITNSVDHIAAINPHNNWMICDNDTDFAIAPSAAGDYAIAIGDSANASHTNEIAIGKSSGGTGTGAENISLGFGAGHSNNVIRGIAIGKVAQATDQDGIAIGTNASADKFSIAIGGSATGTNSVSLGHTVANSTSNSVKIGWDFDKYFEFLNNGHFTLTADAAQFVIPSYTTAGLPAGTTGGLVYDTDINALKFYDGSWIAAGTGATILTELGDVTITSAADGQVLVYGGSPLEMVNRLLVKTDISDSDWISGITAESLGELSDVLLTGSPALTTDDILYFDGSDWVHVPKVDFLSHTEITDIGTNTHAQIDTHIGGSPIHVDHTTVDITAGEGLTGGGDITTTRTIDMDIPGLAEETLPTSDDFVVIYENTGTTHKKVALANLPSGSTAYADEAGNLITDVRNESGDILYAGDAVYISGWSVGNDIILVDEADASSASTMPCLGIIRAQIANNAQGAVVVDGLLENINTSSWTTGDALYVDVVAGDLTTDRPPGAGDQVQKVGTVLRSHAATGSITVSGAGRTNDVPNLTTGSYWKGVSNIATEGVFNTDVDARISSASIDDLVDVDLAGSPALATDDVLTYDGANWVHTPKESGISHLNINDIGSNSHADIDTAITNSENHIAATNPHNNWVEANNGVDFTTGSTAAGADAIAIGNNSNATGDNSIAIGETCTGSVADTIVLGNSSYATGIGGISIGRTIQNTIAESVRIGYTTTNTLHLKDTGTLTLEGAKAQFVQPNYTTAGLPVGVEGGTVYDTDTNSLKVYGGSPVGWISAGSFTDHTDLLNIGTNDHTEIDTHIGAINPHNNWMSCDGDTDFAATANGSGTNAIAIGDAALASATGTISIGDGANAGDQHAIAIGTGSIADGGAGFNIAIGHNSTASANYAVALGKDAAAAGAYSVAIGHAAVAPGAGMQIAVNNALTTLTLNDAGVLTLTGTKAQFVATNYTTGGLPVGITGGLAYDITTNELKVFDTSWNSIGPQQLTDLSDVNTATVTDKFVLVADGVDFESRLLLESDISDMGTYLEDLTSTSIDTLSDVYSSMSPNDGDVLTYDTTNGWQSEVSLATDNWVYANDGSNFTTMPVATATNSIAIGDQAVAIGDENGIAIGQYARVINGTSGNDIAIGTGSLVSGGSGEAIAIGYEAAAISLSVAIGYSCSSDGGSSTAVGRNCTASGSSSVAIGNTVVASVDNSVRIGQTTINIIQVADTGVCKLEGAKAQFVQPNYTTAGLPVGVTGGLVYDTDTNELKVYDTSWNTVGTGAAQLTDLSDVNTATVTDKFVLVADGVDFESRLLIKTDISDADWISDIVSESIGDLSDVVLTGSPALAPDDVLIFDGANWVHGSAPSTSENWVHANNGSDFGTTPTGTGVNAIAIGNNANAAGQNDVAIGTSCDTGTSAAACIAIGYSSNADAFSQGNAQCTAIGPSSCDVGKAGVAVTGSTAVGTGCDVSGNRSLALGYDAAVITDDTMHIAVGTGATKSSLWLSDNGNLSLGGDDAQFVAPSYATASEPTATEGGIIYDSTTNKIKFYNGASWETYQAAGVYLENVSEDASPTLGGDLDGDGNSLLNVAQAFEAQTGTSYTGVLADAGKMVTMSNAAANTFTIPANASVAYPVGTQIHVQQVLGGATTIDINTDTANVNANLTLVLNGQWAVATCMKMTATTWTVFGNLVAA